MVPFLDVMPSFGPPPLTVQIDATDVRVAQLMHFRIDFGDGSSIDDFKRVDSTEILEAVNCKVEVDSTKVCDFRVTHTYGRTGDYSVVLSQVGMCGSDPPRCEETKILATVHVQVGK